MEAVSVIGLGKLGLPMAACLASKQFEVIGADLNEDVVAAVNARKTSLVEAGLDSLLANRESVLSATLSTEEAVRNSAITFITVPTPSEPDGSFSLRYVLSACESIGRVLREKQAFHVIVVTSTVMPGSTDGEVRSALERISGKRCGVDFGLCYSPEFIALGSVIHDFLNPDFLLIGESDSRSGDILQDALISTCDSTPTIARMNIVNAELAKIAVNTFVTTKISFANMIARISERIPGAQTDVITGALGLDSRIGPKYLKGAVGYGGPCFPRDNLALAQLGRSLGAPVFIAEATDRANRQEVIQLKELVTRRLPTGGTVGILGLSYKPETDVVEESQGLMLAQLLSEDGVPTVVHDPAALGNAMAVLPQTVRAAPSASVCVRESDVVVVTTPWKQFERIRSEDWGRAGRPRVVFDCWRILPRRELSGVVDYVALGEFLVSPDVDP
jgi:UDPglucose 6-dehydrogenase